VALRWREVNQQALQAPHPKDHLAVATIVSVLVAASSINSRLCMATPMASSPAKNLSTTQVSGIPSGDLYGKSVR